MLKVNKYNFLGKTRKNTRQKMIVHHVSTLMLLTVEVRIISLTAGSYH